jgi:hypothetical protein
MCVSAGARLRSTHATVQQLLMGTESAQNMWVAQFRARVRDTVPKDLILHIKSISDPYALLHAVDAGPAAVQGVGSGTVTHTRSLLQNWFGSGAQAQAQAQSQSFGGFSQAQSQAQGEVTAYMPNLSHYPYRCTLRGQLVASSAALTAQYDPLLLRKRLGLPAAQFISLQA